ncbi:hypothetical protein D9M69_640990 [compost metagenome]
MFFGGSPSSNSSTTPMRIRSLILTSTGRVQQLDMHEPHIGAEYLAQVSRRSISAAAIRFGFIIVCYQRVHQGARSYREWWIFEQPFARFFHGRPINR